MRFTLENKALVSSLALRDFFQHYIMARLSEYSDTVPFVFIGGTMLRVCSLANYRYSEDLDFKVSAQYSDILYYHILQIVEEINSHPDITSYIYKNELDKDMISVKHKKIKRTDIGLDINIMEENGEEQTEELYVLNNYKSIVSNNKIVCYTLDQVVSAKFNCICCRYKGRDIFDLCFLLENIGTLREGYIMYSETEHTLTDKRFTNLAGLTKHLINKEYKFFDEWKKDQSQGFILYDYGFYDNMDALRKEIGELEQELLYAD